MDFNDEENIEWLMESSKTVENVGETGDDFERTERESIELCRFLQILRASFESEPILIESKAKGTIKSDDGVQKLIRNLKVLGYFFSIRTSEKKINKQNCKLMIVNKKAPPSSHPYRVLSHVRYYCSQKTKEENSAEKQGKNKRTTNCRAILDIREIEIFTTVLLPAVRRRRIELLRNFRRSLLSKSAPVGEMKYAVIVSLPKMHSHPVQVKGQYLNDDVKAVMHYVLRTGTTSLHSIQEKIYQIVDREFENHPIKPSRDNTAFYPNQKTIYNHLRRDGLLMGRLYKKNGGEVNNLKSKTKDLLNSVIEKIETCNNLTILTRVYKRCQNVANDLAGKDTVK